MSAIHRRRDMQRVRRASNESAKLYVKQAHAGMSDKLAGLVRLGFKTWGGMAKAIARAKENDWKRRHGRSAWQPHDGARQLERAQRVGSPAWHAWQHEKDR